MYICHSKEFFSILKNISHHSEAPKQPKEAPKQPQVHLHIDRKIRAVINADSPHLMLELYSGLRKRLQTKLRHYDQSTFERCKRALTAARVKKHWDGATSNQKAARRKQDAEQHKLKRSSRDSNEVSSALEKDRSRKKQKPSLKRSISVADTAIKKAKIALHSTKDPENPTKHKSNVCIACDCFIFSTDRICTITKAQLKVHRHRLGVHEYEQFHGVSLRPELIKQYHVRGCTNLLLSPRAKRLRQGWMICGSCKRSLSHAKRISTKPPKESIANGFVIGTFPSSIKRINPISRRQTRRDINLATLPSELKALLAPVRPYAYLFAYTGGSHQSIQGHVQCFEQSQEKLVAL